jgi:hypothetical protein
MKTVLAAGKPFDAYAVIVDINSFTSMVRNAVDGPAGGMLIADFVRDCLGGAVVVIERNGGAVVGVMGDAILAFVPEGGDRIFHTCADIAKYVDRTCEYISTHQQDDSQNWYWSPGGPSVKVCVEWGRFDVSTLSTTFLGDQRLFIGNAINYAARIGKAGEGNRCLLGPVAARRPELSQFGPDGPHHVDGKPGESKFEYFVLELGEIWREGTRETGDESYWG